MKRKTLYIISVILLIALVCSFFVACDNNVEGKSAYELAVEQGFQGTLDEWLESLKGKDGSDGKDGIDGINGTDGLDGLADINAIYDKAVEEGFQGSYFDFLREYLESSDSVEAAANIGLMSAVKVRALNPYKDIFDRDYTDISSGSGVIYRMNKEQGDAYIVTNYHVVYTKHTESKISENITVYLFGYESEENAIEAKYIAGAYDYDIAILKVSDSDIIKNSMARAANLASGNDVVAGSTVFAVGNPSSGNSSSDFSNVKISVTKGVISVDSETLSVADSNLNYSITTRVMRVDAAINSGNSGGGLYNSKGQLLGIVNAKATSTSIENMGYAIPIDVVKGIADYAIENCDGENNRKIKKLYLGIGGIVNSSKAVYDGKVARVVEEIAVGEISDGSMVKDILQQGDILQAVEFDGIRYEITRSFSLPDCLWNVKAGMTNSIKFYIIRDGEKTSVDVAVTQENFSELK